MPQGLLGKGFLRALASSCDLQVPLVPIQGLLVTHLHQKPLTFWGQEVIKAPRATSQGASGAWELGGGATGKYRAPPLKGRCTPFSQVLDIGV